MGDSIRALSPLDWNVPEPRAGAKDDPARIKETAKQFEALLIGQMMRSMRESSGEGWLSSGEDKSSSSLSEFAEQQVAQVLSACGGFGLTPLIEQGLSKQQTHQPQRLMDGAAAGE